MSLVSRFSRVVALAVTVASPAVAQEDQLAKCEKPFGILAVNEPQDQYMRVFQRYQLGSPAALLRMMAQNSKCFVVVSAESPCRTSSRSARLPGPARCSRTPTWAAAR